MKVLAGFEKRDWGTGRPTWRPVPAVLRRQRFARGPSRYALRRLSNRRAKRALLFGEICLY